MRRITTSTKQTFALAKKFALTLRGGEVIALSGNLGVGKTVFTKGIAAGLGVKKTITSPTFTLMNIYPVKRKNITQLIHIDCYRLKTAAELEAIGVNEYLNQPDVITVIEWPEKIFRRLPKNTIAVTIKHEPHLKRIITIRRHQ